MRSAARLLFVAIAVALVPAPLVAQVDFSGEWELIGTDAQAPRLSPLGTRGTSTFPVGCARNHCTVRAVRPGVRTLDRTRPSTSAFATRRVNK
jgi:hypothetical protein